MVKKNSRKLDLEQTHRKILLVASELFMEKGFKNTSTREIAERCQITQPNLYHHFKNKKELYIAVIEQLTDSVQKDLTVIIEEPLPVDEKLCKMIHVLLEKHPTNLFLMLHDMFREMEVEYRSTLYTIFKQTYINSLAAVFTHENSLVQLRDGVSVDDATRFVLYNVSSILSIQTTYQRKTKQEDVKKFVDLMLHGLT